jgi:hypothetical protein
MRLSPLGSAAVLLFACGLDVTPSASPDAGAGADAAPTPDAGGMMSGDSGSTKDGSAADAEAVDGGNGPLDSGVDANGPNATNGIRDGDETDVDCGGTSAPACKDTKVCLLARDCVSKVCTTGSCAAPTPTDGVQNGTETDVDCGGSVAPRCLQNQKCAIKNDCVNGLCNGGTCANVFVYDVNHVISTGQSNAIANGGDVLSTTQPYNNLSFNTGVMTSLACDGDGCKTYDTPTSFVPLVEGDRFFNFATETMSAGLANQATYLAKQVYWPANPVVTDFASLVSLHGRSGNVYYCLRKGGCPTWYPGRGYLQPFTEGMQQVTDAKAIATALGKSYAVRAVTAIHGESDNDNYLTIYPYEGTDGTANKITNYADALVEWQQDYETSAKAITGQTAPIPLLISQMHGWTWNAARNRAFATLDQYKAHKRALGKVVIVAPTYTLPFNNDWLHFTGIGQRRLGEYFAKAYMHTVVTGTPWEPLRPQTVTRAGNEITVKFMVPMPPLAFDTTLVSALPDNAYGFEYRDDSGAPPTIQSVVLVGADSVKITLSGIPTGANKVVRYAFTRQAGGGCVPASGCQPGPVTGVRGNLRDSDTTPSQSGGAALYNWGITFEEPVL